MHTILKTVKSVARSKYHESRRQVFPSGYSIEFEKKTKKFVGTNRFSPLQYSIIRLRLNGRWESKDIPRICSCSSRISYISVRPTKMLLEVLSQIIEPFLFTINRLSSPVAQDFTNCSSLPAGVTYKIIVSDRYLKRLLTPFLRPPFFMVIRRTYRQLTLESSTRLNHLIVKEPGFSLC